MPNQPKQPKQPKQPNKGGPDGDQDAPDRRDDRVEWEPMRAPGADQTEGGEERPPTVGDDDKDDNANRGTDRGRR